jgi:hypothetical protein
MKRGFAVEAVTKLRADTVGARGPVIPAGHKF